MSGSIPPGFRVSAGFDSGRGDSGDLNGMGVPAAAEPVVLFLPANISRVSLMVFLLVLAAIDDKNFFTFTWLRD
jgi:hypothetical protein